MSSRTTIVAAVFLLVLADCGCESYSRSTSGFSSLDKKLLYDFRDAHPTGNLPVEPSTGAIVAGTYDLDGDGKNELLLESSSINQGRQLKSARLVQHEKDKLVTVEDFGQVYDNSCGGRDGSMSASTIYYLPPPAGQKPRFTVELYRAPCPAPAQQPQWTRVNAQ